MFEITLTNGKLTNVRSLDRGAGDLLQMQISRAEEALWSIVREQTTEVVGDLESIRF